MCHVLCTGYVYVYIYVICNVLCVGVCQQVYEGSEQT